MRKKKILVIIVLVLISLIVFSWYSYKKFQSETDKAAKIAIIWLCDVVNSYLSGEPLKPTVPAIPAEEMLKKRKLANYLIVTYKDLGGLRTGDKVRYRGELVGKVEIFKIKLEPEGRYEVLIIFKDRNFRVKKNSNFYICTLGGNVKYIEIVPGEGQEYIEKGSYVKGIEPITITLDEIQTILKEKRKFKDTADDILDLAEIKERLAYGFSKSGNSVRVPVGKILLIRKGDKYGAIKITKSGEDFADYEWHYQGDGTGDFNSKTATHGTGRVFEKYEHKAVSPERYVVIDKGSELYIKLGDFKLEWSQSDWIYFPEKEDLRNPIEMALTKESDIQKIDVKSPELKFYKRR